MRKLRCLVSGEMRYATPEELVRQQFLEILLRRGYDFGDIKVNFTARFGSQAKFIDVAIFRQVHPNEDRYQQRNVMLVAEIKRHGLGPSVLESAVEQAKSYASACTNCVWCAVYDEDTLRVYRKGYVRNSRGERSDWMFVNSEFPKPEQVGLPLPPATLNREPPKQAAVTSGPLQVTRMIASNDARHAWGSWTDEDRATEMRALRDLPATASAMGLAIKEREKRPWAVPVTQRMAPVTERMPKPPKPELKAALATVAMLPLMVVAALVLLVIIVTVALQGFMFDKLRN